MKWSLTETDCNLSLENLKNLADNRIPYIRVKNFIKKEDLEILLQQLDIVGFDYYQNVNPPIGKIGTTVFENQDSCPTYFDMSRKILNKLSIYAPEHKKAVESLKKRLTKLGLSQKHGNPSEEYFTGLIRIMRNGALLHIDFAPFDAKNYSIKNIRFQIACNIFLKLPQNGGGHTIVYNRQWHHQDELYKMKNSYGYLEDVVELKDSVNIIPEAGDLILFNSRNFHEVKPNKSVEDDRITLSCFAGIDAEQKTIEFWS